MVQLIHANLRCAEDGWTYWRPQSNLERLLPTVDLEHPKSSNLFLEFPLTFCWPILSTLIGNCIKSCSTCIKIWKQTLFMNFHLQPPNGNLEDSSTKACFLSVVYSLFPSSLATFPRQIPTSATNKAHRATPGKEACHYPRVSRHPRINTAHLLRHGEGKSSRSSCFQKIRFLCFNA